MLHQKLQKPVGAAIASPQSDVPPLNADEYAIIGECLGVLSHFNDATVELSEEEKKAFKLQGHMTS